MKFKWLLPLLLLGCSSKHFILPPTYGIDPKFTPDQAAVIKDVFQAWCDAVGYCPVRDDTSIFGFVFIAPGDLGSSDACPAGQTCFVAGRNYIFYIMISSEPWALKPKRLWEHLAHEVGHYCIKNHLQAGLMVPYNDGTIPQVIDEETIKAWKAKCR